MSDDTDGTIDLYWKTPPLDDPCNIFTDWINIPYPSLCLSELMILLLNKLEGETPDNELLKRVRKIDGKSLLVVPENDVV